MTITLMHYQVLKDLDAAGLSPSDEDKLKSMPRGYEAHSDHEYSDLLKFRRTGRIEACFHLRNKDRSFCISDFFKEA